MAHDVMSQSGIKHFSSGDIIIQQGAMAREMILILHGNVSVFQNFRLATEQQVKVLGQGSFYGERALFLGKKQEDTLVALTNVTTATINHSNLLDFFTSHPHTAVAIAEGLTKTLDEALTKLKEVHTAQHASAPSHRHRLFPAEHGIYQLSLDNTCEYLYRYSAACPLCGQEFDALGVLQSKLRTLKTDEDGRVHYHDFEPHYYEVITCPNCLFSAQAPHFEAVARAFASPVSQTVGKYRLEVHIQTGLKRDSFTVFAGYYLALLCAPVVFDHYQMITANLWVKLSRIYQDCADTTMYNYAVDKALADYHYVYRNMDLSEKQFLQVCLSIGDLYMKQNSPEQARSYYFTVKASKDSTKLMKRQADNRLEEIRERTGSSKGLG